MVKLEELKDWLEHSTPGEKRIYYRGYLVADRFGSDPKTGRLSEELPVEPVNSIAVMMQEARERGEVELYQRRHAPWEFEYWAVKL